MTLDARTAHPLTKPRTGLVYPTFSPSLRAEIDRIVAEWVASREFEASWALNPQGVGRVCRTAGMR